jgi:DNA-binding NtrC family response regulator
VLSAGLVAPSRVSAAGGSGARGRNARTSLAAAVEKLEREMIESALHRSGGNVSRTARALGLTRRGLYLKMARLDITNDLVPA